MKNTLQSEENLFITHSFLDIKDNLSKHFLSESIARLQVT